MSNYVQLCSVLSHLKGDRIVIRIPTDRQPTHPGEMLKEEFLEPMGISQRQLADALGVPYQRINEIVNGRPEITGSTALRLAKYWQVSPSPHSPLPTPQSLLLASNPPY